MPFSVVGTCASGYVVSRGPEKYLVSEGEFEPFAIRNITNDWSLHHFTRYHRMAAIILPVDSRLYLRYGPQGRVKFNSGNSSPTWTDSHLTGLFGGTSAQRQRHRIKLLPYYSHRTWHKYGSSYGIEP